MRPIGQDTGEAVADGEIMSASRHGRSAIMAKAHRDYRAARRRGDDRSFGHWLAYAWRVAKGRRELAALMVAA